jgi:transposase InsO family protein
VIAGDGDFLDLTWIQNFETRTEARSAIFEWIEMFYNHERLHETLGDVSPVRYEALSIVL